MIKPIDVVEIKYNDYCGPRLTLGGCKVIVNGQEINRVTDINIMMEANGLTRITLELLAHVEIGAADE